MALGITMLSNSLLLRTWSWKYPGMQIKIENACHIPTCHEYTSKHKAMDNLAQVTPDKFQTNDNVIWIQDQ